MHGNNLSLDPSIRLLQQFIITSNGAPYDVALNAAANYMINIVSRSCPNKAKAEEVFDYFMHSAKTALLSQYDSVSGKKRQILPTARMPGQL